MDKARILRELEYLSGGINVVKTLFKNDEKQQKYYFMFDTWNDIIFNIIDMVEKDDENAENT